MNIIKTAFGDIDLDHEQISFWITDSSIGAKRKVFFEGISGQSEQEGYAHIVWKISQYDDQENLISPLDAVQDRIVITPVSGQNKVTSDGILIIRELFPEGEVGDSAYQDAYDNGHNEYKYWMALLRIAPLTQVIKTAGQLLNQYQRFDRE